MKSFKLFLEGLSNKERADIKAALDAGKTVTGVSKNIEGKFKILKFTTVISGVNRIPRALIDDGNKKRYIDTMAIDSFKINESIEEGEGKYKGETWEQGYKRRVVRTTKPEHKEKGYNWRIKGKERNEISIKLYKSKPSFAQYKQEMKMVAGHEFGG